MGLEKAMFLLLWACEELMLLWACEELMLLWACDKATLLLWSILQDEAPHNEGVAWCAVISNDPHPAYVPWHTRQSGWTRMTGQYSDSVALFI